MGTQPGGLMEHGTNKDPFDNDELLSRCIEGDDLAWRELVARYSNLVYSAAMQTGIDTDVANDVFQQVWMELHRSLDRIDNLRAVPRWLVVTTRRIAYRNAVVASRWLHDVQEDSIEPAPGADAHLVALEQRHELEVALGKISDRCERLLRMLFYSSRKSTYQEISDDMGLMSHSVGPLRTRCLRSLRKLLESEQ